MKKIILLTFVIFSLFSFKTEHKNQRSVIDFPTQTGWVNDFEAIFTQEQIKGLDSLLTAYEKKTSIEIALITIPSSAVEKENFYELVFEIAKSWGVGKVEKDNGILIGISKGHRLIYITNGIGIEKMMSDSETKKVIDKKIIPNFKKENYYAGTLAGIQEIIRIIEQNIQEHKTKIKK